MAEGYVQVQGQLGVGCGGGVGLVQILLRTSQEEGMAMKEAPSQGLGGWRHNQAISLPEAVWTSSLLHGFYR